MDNKEKVLTLRPLSVGSMELMQRFGCGFMQNNMDLKGIIEYVYIHTENIDKLESLTIREFQEEVRQFKYTLSPDDLTRISALVGNQAKEVNEASFTVEDSKKKRVGISQITLFKWFGRLLQKRATP